MLGPDFVVVDELFDDRVRCGPLREVVDRQPLVALGDRFSFVLEVVKTGYL